MWLNEVKVIVGGLCRLFAVAGRLILPLSPVVNTYWSLLGNIWVCPFAGRVRLLSDVVRFNSHADF